MHKDVARRFDSRKLRGRLMEMSTDLLFRLAE